MSRVNEATLTTTLADLPDALRASRVASPAILIVGAVAALAAEKCGHDEPLRLPHHRQVAAPAAR